MALHDSRRRRENARKADLDDGANHERDEEQNERMLRGGSDEMHGAHDASLEIVLRLTA